MHSLTLIRSSLVELADSKSILQQNILVSETVTVLSLVFSSRIALCKHGSLIAN